MLRAWLLCKAAQLREADATPFTVTAGCMLVVGGDDDDTDMAVVHGAAPTRNTPPAAVRPRWLHHVTFSSWLAPDGTLSILAELEAILTPRFFAPQRSGADVGTNIDGVFVQLEGLAARTRIEPRAVPS